MTIVKLLRPFLSAEFDFFGIHHDYVIAVVNMRRPSGLVLARQRAGNAYRKLTKTLSGSIDDVPTVRGLCRRLLIGAHNQGILRESPVGVKDSNRAKLRSYRRGYRLQIQTYPRPKGLANELLWKQRLAGSTGKEMRRRPRPER